MKNTRSNAAGRFSILIVDDEEAQRGILAGYLKKQRFTVIEASSGKQACEILRNESVDVVLTDFRMPEMTGLELLQKLRTIQPEIAVVLMTAFGTIEGAVEAIRGGAYDYLTKPINLDELDLLITRIAERTGLISENRILRQQLSERYAFDGIVSNSSVMESVLAMASRVAESDASVLIRGESGTGKELIAKAIHYHGPRKAKPFVAVNCAALSEHLLESELFGHERGAFTGAQKQRAGRFEIASGGTLFLDEIGDISPAVQVKLLRVLQEHTFERVGGTETISSDVRILAATNRDLEGMITSSTFREDLYYRLNVVTIEIPPLRKRRDDIPMIIEFYLRKYSTGSGKKKISFSREAWDAMLRYEYPGNVRELENIVQRAVILARGDTITLADLPQVVKNLPDEFRSTAVPSAEGRLTERVELLEKEMIFEALRMSGGNQSKAALRLGISERNLRYRLKKWKIS
jgi:two-component system NtrC family response regulator